MSNSIAYTKNYTSILDAYTFSKIAGFDGVTFVECQNL